MNRLTALWVALFAAIVIYPSHSKNSGPQRNNVDTIVLHSIGGPVCDKEKGKVVFTPAGKDADYWKAHFEGHKTFGVHYVIDRKGKTVKSIPENQVANHAYGHNKTSIGVELVNKGDGKDPFPSVQIDALVKLIKEIRNRWKNISVSNVKRHSDVDTRTFDCGGKKVKKKQDPGNKFPYEGIISRIQ